MTDSFGVGRGSVSGKWEPEASRLHSAMMDCGGGKRTLPEERSGDRSIGRDRLQLAVAVEAQPHYGPSQLRLGAVAQRVR